MRELYQARDRLEAQLLADYLAGYHIRTVVHGEFLGGAAGELPVSPGVPLWILEERDFGRARELVDHFLARDAGREAWICPRCGERNEAEFHLCWRCECVPESR
ncbi:MAG: DUF2007 domain-containing protein [Gammaproteobacteria bacterium]|nr:DUF2007 domain-containing protein [Gammaproteobacteria bacterium]